MHSRELRQIHAAEVFHAILVEPEVSQLSLRLKTGLDRSTVSKIVSQLLTAGIIERDAVLVAGKRGRPTETLSVSDKHGLLIGAHREFNSLRVVATTMSGQLVTVVDAPLSEPGNVGESIAATIHDICNERGRALEEVRGIGVTAPGQVGLDGILRDSPNLGWHDIDIKGQLTRLVSVPVYVDNDVKAAAAAEYLFGAARRTDDFLFVDAGEGVGAAIFVDGDVFRGTGGFAGEFGHSKIVPGGRACHCGGVGCVAAYLSRSALLARASELGTKVATLETLEARAAAGDPVILDLLAVTARLGGMAVSNVVNIVNPPVVFLSGLFARLWPFTGEEFKASLRANCLEAAHQRLEIHVANNPTHDFPRGGIATALHGLIIAPFDAIPGRQPSGRPDKSEKETSHAY